MSKIDWSKFKNIQEFYEWEREQQRIKNSKPINRAKKTSDGWFIPAMNSKRYSCEINRQSYKKMTTPRIKMMQKKDRMQERNIKVNFQGLIPKIYIV